MGVAVVCILEKNVRDIPDMEGKSLCMAFCGEAAGGNAADAGPASNVVTLDFGGSGPSAARPPAAQEPVSQEALFASLGEFITGDRGVEWHEPSRGLAVVRSILARLRAGAEVSLDPDFDFCEDDAAELTAGVTFDLETLEEMLIAAQRERTRFRLLIDA